MDAWIAAFRNSCAGLIFAVRTERAVRQEVLALIVVIPAALIIGQTLWIKIALICVVLLLMAVELLNTCIEKLCDHVTPAIHPQIKVVKDMGSAAVLAALLIVASVWMAAIAQTLGLV
ncbi:MAG: diacylglycerol kinase [Beijerinckiaceae bacterium]|nr:diacylglycerol kinase [Beijerinckiaceae bacterium]